MTQPSKEAIAKACELQGYRADWYAKGGYYDEVQTAQIEDVARFIDHVSDVAKANDDAFTAWAMGKYFGNTDEAKANAALILPDPEPDVLAEAMFASNYDFQTRDAAQDYASTIRTELTKPNLFNRDGPEAADLIQSQASQIASLSAVMERCAKIVDRNLYHQSEKIADVPKLLRDALASTESSHD